MNNRNNQIFFIALTLAIVIRLILMIQTTHVGSEAKIAIFDELFLAGNFIPIKNSGWGLPFYAIFFPSYSLILLLSTIGIQHHFLAVFLFKIPPVVGDFVVFIALIQISKLCKLNFRQSLAIGCTYIFNPYVIWMSSVVGHVEQFVAGLILLTIVNIYKGNYKLSASYLAMAVTFRPNFIVLIPIMLRHIRKIRDLVRFLPILGILTILFLSPLYLFFILNPNQDLLTFARHLTDAGGSGHYGLASLKTVGGNFTGPAVFFGILDLVKSVLNLQTFIIIFIAVTTIFIKFKATIRNLVNYYTIIFAIALLSVTVSQHHYLLWIFPLLIIQAKVFRNIPLYIPTTLWVSNMLLDPALTGAFFYYLGDTFPAIYEKLFPMVKWWKWNVYNANFEFAAAVSLLTGIILILTVIKIAQSHIKEHNIKILKKLDYRVFFHRKIPEFLQKRWYFTVVIVYSLFDIIRFTILKPQITDQIYLSITIVSLIISIILFIPLIFYKYKIIIKDNNSKLPILYWIIIWAINIGIILLIQDIPIFSIVIGITWLINSIKTRYFNSTLSNTLNIILFVYISYFLIIIENIFFRIGGLIFTITWIMLLTFVIEPKPKTTKSLRLIKYITTNFSLLRYLIIILLISSIFISPLTQVIIKGEIPNSRSIRNMNYDLINMDFSIMNSTGIVQEIIDEEGDYYEKRFVIGDLDSSEESSITLKYPTLFFESLSEDVRKKIRIRLMIDNTRIAQMVKCYCVNKIMTGHRSELDFEDFVHYAGDTTSGIKFNSTNIKFEREFEIGEGRNTRLYKIDFDPPIWTSDRTLIIFDWKSTGNVGRLTAYHEWFDEDERKLHEHKVLMEQPEELGETAIKWGGAYSESWTHVEYDLPSEINLTRIDLGIDNGDWDVDGLKAVYFKNLLVWDKVTILEKDTVVEFKISNKTRALYPELLTIESESYRFNKLIPMGHIADFLARIDYEYGDIEEHINQLFDKNKRLEDAAEQIRKFDYSLGTEEYRLWKIDHNKELVIELSYEDVKTGNVTITVEPYNEVRINNIWMEIGPLKPTQVNQFWLQIPTPIFFVSVVLAITLLIFNIVKLKKTPENEKEMKI